MANATLGRVLQRSRDRVAGHLFTGATAGRGADLTKSRRDYNPERYWMEVYADNPIAFWPVNDRSGTSFTEWVASRDAPWLNSPTLGVGGLPRHSGATFNGSNQTSYCSQHAVFNVAPSGNWSIEAWMKFTNSGTSVMTFIAWKVYDTTPANEVGNLCVNNTVAGRVQVNTVNSTNSARVLATSDGWNDGKWHHVVGTSASGGSLTLYIDGVARDSNATARSSGSASNRGVSIGSNIGFSPSQYFDGSVSCGAVYGTCLSAARVRAHYMAMADCVSC